MCKQIYFNFVSEKLYMLKHLKQYEHIYKIYYVIICSMNVFIKYSISLYMYIYGTVYAVSAIKLYISICLTRHSNVQLTYVTYLYHRLFQPMNIIIKVKSTQT